MNPQQIPLIETETIVTTTVRKKKTYCHRMHQVRQNQKNLMKKRAMHLQYQYSACQHPMTTRPKMIKLVMEMSKIQRTTINWKEVTTGPFLAV